MKLAKIILLSSLILSNPLFAKAKQKKKLPPPLPSLGSTKDFGMPRFDYDPTMFSMQLANTTLESAIRAIEKEGGHVDQQSYGETVVKLNTLNSTEEKEPTILNKNIILAEFSGLPLDHLSKGRMGFVNNKMYFLYYEFNESLKFDELEKQVVAKYGKPHRIGGFPDRFLEWKFLNSSLVLKDNFIGSDRMIFTHEKLLKQANDSNKIAIKEQKELAIKQQKAF